MAFVGRNDDEKEVIKLDQKFNHDAIRDFWRQMQGGDAILAANYERHGIANYIGGNTLMEIGFAHVLGQRIYLLNPIPAMAYCASEIEAVRPIVLDGDVSRLPSDATSTRRRQRHSAGEAISPVVSGPRRCCRAQNEAHRRPVSAAPFPASMTVVHDVIGVILNSQGAAVVVANEITPVDHDGTADHASDPLDALEWSPRYRPGQLRAVTSAGRRRIGAGGRRAALSKARLYFAVVQCTSCEPTAVICPRTDR